MDEELRYLYAPPDSEVAPPVRTSAQLLPLNALSWPDFERLCLRLVRTLGGVEHAQLYGVPGQAQGGIDIYARRAGGYAVYQCRRVASFSPAGISDVVTDFLEGMWRDRATELVLCTTADLSRTELAEAVEAAHERLRRLRKDFLPWDVGRLSEELKTRPALILDFFGRSWVEAFVPHAVEELADRLDAQQLRQLRGALREFYSNLFAQQDTAILLGLSDENAWQRFVIPDVAELREVVDAMARLVRRDDAGRGQADSSSVGASTARVVEQRMPLDEWLAKSPRHVLIADAGGGKSSALRFTALDLLSDEPRLVEVLQRWETFVPVWIPFGFWVTRMAAEGATSLTQAVRLWLASYDEERLWPLIEDGLRDGRVLLLVDGLDEWTDAAAAVETFSHLAVFVRQRDLPLVATSRPTALEELGPLPREWNLGSLAGLSINQQRAIVEALDADATSEFLDAISRSSDLRGLAATPLLLILLLRLYGVGQALPRNRFAAYAAVIDFLLEDHPRRRGVTPSGPRPTRELKAALARIAFEIQGTGDVVISEAHAESASAEYFEDGTVGLGLPRGEARAAANAVVADARTRLGLLVRAAPGSLAFPHRSLQEYLAAFCLSAWPLDGRQAVVAERGPEPAWHEVILNVIALSESAEADSLIGVVQQNRTPLERWMLQPLLADIAAARFGSPMVAERLAGTVIDLIETAPASSLRLDVLARASDAVSEVDEFRRRAPSWLPSLEQNRRRVFEAMRSWPEEAATKEAIWRGMFDEDTATARAAARTYAERYSEEPHAHERLVELLRQPLEGKVRAAALEALVSSWPDDDTIPHLMERARASVDPNLRLVAHRWRIECGEQTDDDLADLIALGGYRGNVDYDRRDDLWIAIKDGWPRNEAIKAAALRTSRRHGSSRELELDLALWLLLAGYPGDPDVITYCINQIEHEEHPFLMLHFDAWRLLAASFRDEPTIVAALDEWIPRQEFREPEVAFACLVGRTEIGKRTMVARMATSSWPHWFAGALLEGWGMADPDVATALTRWLWASPILQGE